MRKLLFLPFVLSLLAVAGCGDRHEEVLEDAVFWRISGSGLTSDSYLLGTRHIWPLSSLDTIPHLREVLENDMEQLVVECLEEEDLVFDGLSVRKIRSLLLPDSLDYRKLLAGDKYNYYALGGYLIKHDLGELMQYRFSPSVLLTAILFQMISDRMPGGNMDDELEQYAKERGLPVFGLEKQRLEWFLPLFSENELIPEFNTLSLKEQVDTLLYIIHYDVPFDGSQDGADLSAYLDSFFKDDPTRLSHNWQEMGAKYYRRLVTRRNRRWMKQIPAHLKRGTTVIAVGAGHLEGPSSLITMLRRKGYTVEPLQ